MVLTLLITAGSIMRATEQCVGLGITVQWGTRCLLSCQVSGSVWSEVCSYVLILVMESEYKLYITGKEEDRKEWIGKVMVISLKLCLVFACHSAAKRMMKLQNLEVKRKYMFLIRRMGILVRILTWRSRCYLLFHALMPMVISALPTVVLTASASLLVLCMLTSNKGPSGEVCLVFSVFRGIEIEIAFSSLGALY